jgi:hypothetical protein
MPFGTCKMGGDEAHKSIKTTASDWDVSICNQLLRYCLDTVWIRDVKFGRRDAGLLKARVRCRMRGPRATLQSGSVQSEVSEAGSILVLTAIR